MKNFLDKFFADPVFSSLLTIIVGILTVVFASVFFDVVSIALGCVALVLGLINVVKYFRTPLEGKYNLLTGLIFGALGLAIIFEPEMLGDLVAVVFGIIILYHGIVNTEHAIAIKKSGYDKWYLSLIFSLITVVAGILLIVLKNVFIDYLAIIIGVIFIIEGILNTWTALKVKKANE